jgi:hypothetical protein
MAEAGVKRRHHPDGSHRACPALADSVAAHDGRRHTLAGSGRPSDGGIALPGFPSQWPRRAFQQLRPHLECHLGRHTDVEDRDAMFLQQRSPGSAGARSGRTCSPFPRPRMSLLPRIDCESPPTGLGRREVGAQWSRRAWGPRPGARWCCCSPPWTVRRRRSARPALRRVVAGSQVTTMPAGVAPAGSEAGELASSVRSPP